MIRVQPSHGCGGEFSFREVVRSRFEDPGRAAGLGECPVSLSPVDPTGPARSGGDMHSWQGSLGATVFG